MTRLSRFAAVVVLVGGATAVLSSCSGDPGPIVTETPSPTAVVSTPPSPSPSATLTPEEELLAQIPEDARAENFVSASNFAKFFLGLYPQLFVDGADTSLFEGLTGDNCGFCRNALADAAETAAADAYSEGGQISFPNVLATGGLQDDGYWYVSDRFEAAATKTYGRDGALLDEAPAYAGEANFRLEYLDGLWNVDEVDLVFEDA